VRLRLDKITSTPRGLVMGVQVRGPKDSWVRFAKLEVPWSEVPQHVVDDWWKWHDHDEIEVDLDVALPLDWR
jgi:hypothetical protein